MKDYSRFRQQLLRDRKIRREYEALGPEFEVIALLTKERLAKGVTQKELAKKIGTKQSAIARLESGTYNPSLAFLFRIADALNARIKISVDMK